MAAAAARAAQAAAAAAADTHRKPRTGTPGTRHSQAPAYTRVRSSTSVEGTRAPRPTRNAPRRTRTRGAEMEEPHPCSACACSVAGSNCSQAGLAPARVHQERSRAPGADRSQRPARSATMRRRRSCRRRWPRESPRLRPASSASPVRRRRARACTLSEARGSCCV